MRFGDAWDKGEEGRAGQEADIVATSAFVVVDSEPLGEDEETEEEAELARSILEAEFDSLDWEIGTVPDELDCGWVPEELLLSLVLLLKFEWVR